MGGILPVSLQRPPELGNDLDLEREAVEPGHTDSCQRAVRRLAPKLRDDLPDRLEIGSRIDDEKRDIDHVVERTASCFQHPPR